MIQESFQRDHEEIDELLNVLRRDLTIKNFEAFDRRLERHIRWEEEILFPAVEGINPQLKEGPGRVMRMEHVEIRDLKAKALSELKQTLKPSASLATMSGLLEQVFSILKNHNVKEEHIYYPMADELLTESDKKHILDKTVFLKS